ncbi:hypothetical protein EYR38_009323 [Pleurotus pulmonarius]|nr:hypothetical protein EYR38_009323 [Pleurotus pulmonarius]
MIIPDHVDQDPMHQLWGLLTEIGEQQNQNRNIAHELHTKANDLKSQAVHSQTGFVLRRFNLDKSKEAYDAELSRMNAGISLENQGLQYDNKQLNSLIKDFETTLESLMGKFRNRAKDVQERELSLIRDYERKLLLLEEENSKRELANSTTISESLARLSHVLRQVLKMQCGEPSTPLPSKASAISLAEPGIGTDIDLEDREPWKAAVFAEQSLERDIELARLEKENEELRRMLGIVTPLQRRQTRSDYDSNGSNEALHDQGQGFTGSSEHLHDASQGQRQAARSLGPYGTFKRKPFGVAMSSSMSQTETSRAPAVDGKAFPHIQYTTTTTTTQMANTTAERGVTPPKSGPLLPFRRNTQPESALRATLLNPKPLVAHAKAPKDASHSILSRTRRASTSLGHPPESKGKERDFFNGKTSNESSSNSPETDADFNTSTSFTSYESNVLHIPTHSAAYSHSRPSTAGTSGAPSSYSPPSLLQRTRGTIFGAASDALGSFKLGRRRTKTSQGPSTLPQPYVPSVILPEVIEISAPRRDEEVEEREKLKEDAARAILGPAFLDNSNVMRKSSDALDEDEGDEQRGHNHDDASAAEEDVQSITQTSVSNVLNGSSISVAKARYRPGSMMSHSRNNSMTPASFPSFPSTPSALLQFSQDSSTLPKYYPSTSLRIFALSKSWKSRYMILSSPITFTSSSRPSPCPSYLHLFKSPGLEEKELERLEINEESVVFVAEEEVAGRRQVVKVGGIDVGAMKRELNYEEGGKTMWLLQITDPAETQKWISGIKNAILGQRTVRAGISPMTPSLISNEPRGDMDVQLTMRRQGIISSPPDSFRPILAPLDKVQPPLHSPSFVTSPGLYSSPLPSTPITPPATGTSFASATEQDSPRKGYYEESRKGTYNSKNSGTNDVASVSSQSIRSQTTTPGSGRMSLVSGNAVTALKGLFNRPRSPSRASHATSFDLERDSLKGDKILIGPSNEQRELGDGSFASMGNSLMNMLKSPDGRTVRLGSSSGHATPQRHHTMLPFSGGPVLNGASSITRPPGDQELGRKIVPHAERQTVGWRPQDNPSRTASNKDRVTKSLSVGSPSLKPPPRKRWTAGGMNPPEATTDHTRLYQHVNGNSSVAGSFGLGGFASHDRSGTQTLPDSSPTVSGHSLGTPEQRQRAPSLQSVSTLASTGEAGLNVERSSTSTKRSSRWSRQGSSMLNVPSPPSMPHAPSHGSASSTFSTNARVHPYAAGGAVDRPPSRTSNHSVASERSVISGLPTFSNSKRASTSSTTSISMSSSPSQGHSYLTGAISRVTNSHRTSMPPPRPAPTSALPPAPDQDVLPKAPSPPKSSFRDVVAQRAFRLSRTAPAPPPPTALPPRPDEIVPPSRSHRRTASAGSGRVSSDLYSTSSPLSISVAPPFPPPLGPLPPTPIASSSLPARHTSIKERLRIRSTPTQSQAGLNGSPPPIASSILSHVPPLHISNSQPATPIAEKITLLQNEFDDPLMYAPSTPTMPNAVPRNVVSPPPDQLQEATPLSPPPRRSSKQMSVFDKEIDGAIAAPDTEQGPTVDIEPKPLSLSHRGSVISLGIVSMSL